MRKRVEERSFAATLQTGLLFNLSWRLATVAPMGALRMTICSTDLVLFSGPT